MEASVCPQNEQKLVRVAIEWPNRTYQVSNAIS